MMEDKIIMTKTKFKAKGMHCTSCETLIEKSLKKIDGVRNVKADYPSETVSLEFDESKVKIKDVVRAVESKGYTFRKIGPKEGDKGGISNSTLGIIFGILGVLVILYFAFRFYDSVSIPEISQNMGYGLLFLVGLLTGFHCISMCGGFVIGYTTKDAEKGIHPLRSHFMYGLGKTASYTIIGAAFGLLGSIIAFTPLMRGVAGILAGMFLIIFGINMLNIFPWLRKVRLRSPQFINRFVSHETREHSSPLIVGLLNGLMIACGPLQAVYIMAAGTGSMIEGAKLLFAFGLGTLPVLLGFGFLTSLISKKATHKILKASGAIIILLGLIMVNRGLALTGTGFDTNSLLATVNTGNAGIADNAGSESLVVMENGYQIIRMDVTRYGWEPDKFVLEKGVPVKWIINGKEINGCNNAIQVPKLGLKFDIKPGEQTIEFTPTQEGVIPWSCWMGMIPGTFIVKSGADLSNTAEVQKELDSVQTPSGGTCGISSGGGCGCGG